MVTGMRQRGDHADPSLLELADESAIRELIDAYADCADRRDVAGQMALFTEDTELVVFADSLNSDRPRDFMDARRSRRYSTNSKTTESPCTSMVKAPQGSTALGPRR